MQFGLPPGIRAAARTGELRPRLAPFAFSFAGEIVKAQPVTHSDELGT